MGNFARMKPAGVDWLNSAGDDAFQAEFARCCGASRWISRIKERRPFSSATAVFAAADEVWRDLSVDDWKEAFSHHPKIGDVNALRDRFSSTRTWAEGEQAGATNAPEQTLRALADGNAAYEQKFGFIFIVCATGKTADEMLLLLKQRLRNDPSEEISIAAEEQRKIIRLRLEKLIGDAATGPEGEHAFQAVKAGDTAALRLLLDQYPSVRRATNAEGVSLLLFAIYNGKKDIADFLVQTGSTFDVFSAAAYGALNEIVNILQEEPALLNAYSPDGWTPLHLASFFGNQSVVEYLVMSRADMNAVSRNSLKNKPLNAATVSNRTDIVRFLAKRGADVNSVQHEGITPLHAAAYNGNGELVHILLSHGADRNARDEKGETPIDKATERGHMNVVSILQP